MLRLLLLPVLLVFMAAIAWSALNACGLRMGSSSIGSCPVPAAAAAPQTASRAGENSDTAALVASLEELRRRLNGAPQCDASVPVPDKPVIAEQEWRDKDVASLAGCWALSSDYKIRNIRTQDLITVKAWKVCLDRSGGGSQEMELSNSAVCSAQVTAKFDSETQFDIDEAQDLICSNDFKIFKRKISCKRLENGGMQCSAFQPQTQGSSDVSLRRITP